MIAADFGGERPRGPQNILVASSQRHVVRLIQVNLQREGHLITAAFRYEEIILQAKAPEFDLIIAEELLHPLGGIALVQELKALSTAALLILAKLPDPAHIEALYAAGANMVVIAPFNPSELISLLR